MSKRNKLVAITLAIIVSGVLIVGISSCGREEVIYQQQPPQQQVVYVQHNGNWMEYAMWYSIMQNSGRPYNVNNYHFATRSGNSYSSYKPSSRDFSQMKTGKFGGKALISRPPVAVKQKTGLFGRKSYSVNNSSGTKTRSSFFGGSKSSGKSSGFFSKSSSSGRVSSFGGSSTRSSSGGFGG